MRRAECMACSDQCARLSPYLVLGTKLATFQVLGPTQQIPNSKWGLRPPLAWASVGSAQGLGASQLQLPSSPLLVPSLTYLTETQSHDLPDCLTLVLSSPP